MSYTPSAAILEKYADVLVNFALGNGKGVKKGEVVWLRISEVAKPFYVPLRNAIIRAGAHPLIDYSAEGVNKAEAYNLSSMEQLGFGFDAYYKGVVEQADHMLYILAEADKYELQDVDPKRVVIQQTAKRRYMEWRRQKEALGKFSWTIAMYGTPAMAADVGMSEEAYWEQIIKACYLDAADPIAEWKKSFAEIERVLTALNSLSIEKVHIEAKDVDLWVGIGAQRKWLGGRGANIPSFEVFISPDWRLTEGTVHFNQPLYRYGNSIEGVRFRFEKGEIVEASASKGEALLKELIATEGANKIGEFSLTDGRLSRITHFMGETLYDENMGGPEGNTHIAVGNAYEDSYPGDASTVSKEQWQAWGYNQSAEHCDIISTTSRTVTAYLTDGSEKVIYKNGQFTL